MMDGVFPMFFSGKQAAQCSAADQSTTQLATTCPAQRKWVKWWLGYDVVVCAGAEAVCTRLRPIPGTPGPAA